MLCCGSDDSQVAKTRVLQAKWINEIVACCAGKESDEEESSDDDDQEEEEVNEEEEEDEDNEDDLSPSQLRKLRAVSQS